MEAKVSVKKFGVTGWAHTQDHLAVEEPLEIGLQWREKEQFYERKVAITMRTPGHDHELAVGFLYNEGVISARKDVVNVQQNSQQINIVLADNFKPDLKKSDRNFLANSSCGVCGKQELSQLFIDLPYDSSTNNLTVESDIIIGLEKEVMLQQQVFSTTGGLHAAALFNTRGNLLALREDVGRHNALDKLIGAMFLNERLPLSDQILFLSGRASFELIQKAAMAGIPIVAAVGAPSTLAVSYAEKSRITLIGFLRQGKFNVYTHAERICVPSAQNQFVNL